MAKDILRNVRIFADNTDLTTMSNKVEISAEVEEKDTTNFGSVDSNGRLWKEVLGGVASWKLSAGGQWEALDMTKVDDQAWADLGSVSAWTVAMDGNVGTAAYVGKAIESNYQLLGAYGDVAPWSANSSGTGAMARGAILHPPGTARTSTGNGTSVLLIASPAGKVVVANLHVLSVSGTTPSLTVKVQSDDNVGFTSPTDQGTFTAATAVGGQSLLVSTAITDTYWRAAWTISGTTPSFLFVVSLGIAPA
jgi:predicted secreted protein